MHVDYQLVMQEAWDRLNGFAPMVAFVMAWWVVAVVLRGSDVIMNVIEPAGDCSSVSAEMESARDPSQDGVVSVLAEISAHEVGARVSAETRVCPYCGSEAVGAGRCASCGGSLSARVL